MGNVCGALSGSRSTKPIIKSHPIDPKYTKSIRFEQKYNN